MSKKDNTIWQLLYNKFPLTQYAVLREVRDAAGFHATRTIDGIAMNLWPSRGLSIHGFELKSGRGDWLKELKSPHKQEDIYQYCDYFWLIAENDQVAHDSEIPKTWGYLVAKNGRLYTKKEAPPLKAKPLSRTFVASMLKRATNSMVHKNDIDKLLQAEFEKGREDAKYDRDRKIIELESLERTVKEFEELTGLTLFTNRGDWTPLKEKANAVKFMIDHDTEELKRKVEKIHESATKMLSNIETIFTELSSTNG